MNNIVTRFAPSPTGYLHIGNIRTALYSWLYARKNNGKFILRIEDTDLNRYKKKYVDYIFYILEWLGLYWDETPYYQSERLDLYKSIINEMLNKDLAYKCYCSVDRLNKLRELCIKSKRKPFYDGCCRDKFLNYKNNLPYVVRFKNSKFGYIVFKDLVFGKINISNLNLDDIIIQRSNGLPTYNFCVIVDDYYMNVSHVIRGEDHLSNTPKQINILNSLNYLIPIYVHLPIILDINGKKLSKRNSDSNILNYINKGFLPESILNYLLRLGWSYKNYEIIHIHEMKYLFDLYKLNKSPCIMNYRKLIWINRYYISTINSKKLILYLKNFFLLNNINLNYLNNFNEIINFYVKRSNTLKDIMDFYLIFSNNTYLKNGINFFLNYLNKDSYKIIIYFLKKISKQKNWCIKSINYIIDLLLKKFYFFSKKKIFTILRFFLTGLINTPELSIIIFFLKKKEIQYRLNYILNKIFKFIN